MSYTFNAAEQSAIVSALAQCSGLTTQNGSVVAVGAAGTNAVPLYSCLSSLIGARLDSPAGLGSADIADLSSAKLWLDVAIGANANTGMHSAFIRTYTNTQGLLRLGHAFTDAEMQLASNSVAANFANGLLHGDADLAPWTVPSISQIARLDASAIGDALFSQLGSTDTAVSANAGWSGALGFSLLGGQVPFETWRLVSSGDQNGFDTVTDLRDVVFAVTAYKQALMAGFATGIPDFLAAWAVPSSWGPLLAQAAVAQANSPSVFDTDTWGAVFGTLNSTLSNTPLAAVVSSLNDVGISNVLAGLARLGYVAMDTSSEIAAIASVFSGLPASGNVRLLTRFSQENLAQLAESEPAVATALERLSFISVSTLDGSAGQHSAEWMTERAGMLLSMADVNSQDTYYLDKATGLSAGSTSAPKHVVFNASSADATTGVDVLFGTSQGDTLSTAQAHDTLAGGAGDDTYILHAPSTVLENASEGTDTVVLHLGAFAAGSAYVAGYELGANLENGVLDDDAGTRNLAGNELNNVLTGNASSNALSGDGGLDHLIGGAGDDFLIGNDDALQDLLEGGLDFDSYGAGANDVIDDVDGLGSISFQGVTLNGGSFVGKSGGVSVFQDTVQGVTYSYDDTTQTLVAQKNGQDVMVLNFSNSDLGVHLLLDDGSLPAPGAILGTSGSDTLSGTAGADVLAGGGGTDVLSGLGGSDKLLGGAGADTLTGGAGADALYGGAGAELYLFEAGYGLDTVVESGLDNDVIRFGTSVNNTGNVGLARIGNDLRVKTNGTIDAVTIKDWFLGADHQVERIEFASNNGAFTSTQINSWFASAPKMSAAASSSEMASMSADPYGSEMFAMPAELELIGVQAPSPDYFMA